MLFIFCTSLATVALTAVAFRQNMMFFYTPTQLKTSETINTNSTLRLGGLVGNITRKNNDLEIEFEVTDTVNTVLVSYTGVLPDLFREGQGVVIRGNFDGNIMVADEVLAKHDENYIPPEVAQGLTEVGVKWE